MCPVRGAVGLVLRFEAALWRQILSFITFSPDPQCLLSVCPTGPASSWPSEFRSESQSDTLFLIINPVRSGNHFFGILLHLCQCLNMQPPPRKVRNQRWNNVCVYVWCVCVSVFSLNVICNTVTLSRSFNFVSSRCLF